MEARRARPWDSLPVHVLGQCLRSGLKADDMQGAFVACKAFFGAILTASSKPGLQLDLTCFNPASVACALRLAADCKANLSLCLGRQGPEHPSLRPLLSLQQCLPNVIKLSCLFLLLDGAESNSIATMFPNLQHLELMYCQIPEGMLPLTGCTNLRSLTLNQTDQHTFNLLPPADDPAAWLTQLQQLPSLPNLSSLTIDVLTFPTSFLPLLANQLTRLHLMSGLLPTSWAVEKTQEPVWEEALLHAVHVTSLKSLRVGYMCFKPETAAQLTRLEQLEEIGVSYHVGSTDALVSALLQLPKLTQLSFCFMHCNGGLQQSYAKEPCNWKALSLSHASPQLLAKLPLHSLTQPLAINCLGLPLGTRVADVRAAVDNLERSAAPFVIISQGASFPITHFEVDFGMSNSGTLDMRLWERSGEGQPNPQAVLLRAAGPLLAKDAVVLEISHCSQVDGEFASAMKHAAPAIPKVHVWQSDVCPSFWPLLGQAYPQLQKLHIELPTAVLTSTSIMGMYCGLCANGVLASGGGPRVVITLDPEELWAEECRVALTEVNPQLSLLGFAADKLMDVSMRWD